MSADGNWKVVVQSPMGAREFDLSIKTNGAVFTGHSKGAMGESDIEGQVNGDVLTWRSKITNPIPLDLSFTVTVSGDHLNGVVKLGVLGEAKVTGVRQ